jgi:hypothetical protein
MLITHQNIDLQSFFLCSDGQCGERDKLRETSGGESFGWCLSVICKAHSSFNNSNSSSKQQQQQAAGQSFLDSLIAEPDQTGNGERQPDKPCLRPAARRHVT